MSSCPRFVLYIPPGIIFWLLICSLHFFLKNRFIGMNKIISELLMHSGNGGFGGRTSSHVIILLINYAGDSEKFQSVFAYGDEDDEISSHPSLGIKEG